MSRKVRITIELDNEFIKLLRANCTLSKLGNLNKDYKQHTPIECLGIVALLESMGATEAQVNAEIPFEWRPHIQVIHEERKVIEGDIG